MLQRDPTWVWPEPENIEFKSMDSPEHDRSVHVESRSGRTDGFYVNLARMTCTCPGWKSLRAIYGPRDVRRVCPHLLQTMIETGAIERLAEHNRQVLEYGRPFYRFVRFRDPFHQTTITYGFNDHDKDLIKQTRVGCYAVVGNEAARGLWDLREGEWIEPPAEKHETLIREKLFDLFTVK